MTLGWLVGRQIAGQRKAQEKQPIVYTYGSTFFPKIPERDEMAYPYLAITIMYGTFNAYAFSAPLTAKPVPGITGGTAYEITSELPFIKSKLSINVYEHDEWSEWETVTDATVSLSDYGNHTWVNHDIVASDGTKVFSAGGDLTPVCLPIVLYDGEVTTDQPDWADNANGTVATHFEFSVGDTLRVTVNGVSGEYTAEGGRNISLPLIGNAWQYDSDMADDGGDWALCEASAGSGLRKAYFYTRNPGTYQLKIELISIAQ